MDRTFFDGLAHFLAVARHGSFTAGAQAMDISPTAMSKAIRLVEERYGTKLFQRTTRRTALTEAGAELFQRLDRATNEIDDALKSLGNFQLTPTGTLRLTVPRSIMPALVEPHLAAFQRLYPRVKLEISLNDRFVDLVGEGFDAGIRLGDAIDKDMIAVRLTGEARWGIAASPGYWEREGRPKRFEDLVGRRAIMYRFPGSRSLQVWEFQRQGKPVQVQMDTGLIIDDRAALVRLAVQGFGAAFVLEVEVAQELARGDLELMFGDDIPPDDGIFLYFPAAMQSQPKLRAFIDTIRENSSVKQRRPS
ncbi:Bacterial regulatory helix-turn-helix, lysR family protein [Neorhizobium galegae bv. orientalis]|nr:Bacterial regulatory helix-turn-helix, lysR family protein [Neorhizobium galegae bv. orientalis]